MPILINQDNILKLTQKFLAKNMEDVSVDDFEILREIIRYHEKMYYIEAAPIINDYEYDILFNLLKLAEAKDISLITPDSPTQRIGNSAIEQFNTYAHFTPMLSLENSYNDDDVIAFHQRMTEYFDTHNIAYNVEPKLDGAAVSLYYKNDVLVRALTRGDGVEGEDITAHLKTIMMLPLKAPFSQYGLSEAEIRGEIVFQKKDFETFNQQILSKGGIPLANPRNAVAGTLRLKNMHEVRERRLSIFLYHISFFNSTNPHILTSQYDSIQLLANIGLPTMMRAQLTRRCNSIEEVLTYCKTIEEKRHTLPFEIDGMVIKVDSLALQEKIGITSHHPKWAVALKFKPQQAISILKEVEFNVGRTGIITPVAKIDAVPLAGVVVNSISLFNEDNIRQKDILLGDSVIVERAGDVIPYIAASLPQKRMGNEQPIIFPTNCPSCHAPLIKNEGEAGWRCVNYHCGAQNIQRLIHFASKDAMNIRGLGAQIVIRLVEEGLLKQIADIYTLPFDSLQNWERFGEKSINNLKQSIEKSKTQPLYRLIFGLGIRFVGEDTAKTLARSVSHILDLKKFSLQTLQDLENIGPKVAQSVYEYFADDANMAQLQKLEQSGINVLNIKQDTSSHDDHTLIGQTFLFTGTLQTLKRSEAEIIVEQKGGSIANVVNSRLNYLVVGDNPGSKVEKAKKLGNVHIIDESYFLKMIE